MTKTLAGLESPAVTAESSLAELSQTSLEEVEKINKEYEKRWASKLARTNTLTRSLVSFQANKSRAVYRWFKYKEAFSAGLVEHLLHKYRLSKGILLDPFAGSGTALFVAGALGIRTEGIEVLPIGQTIIATKQLIDCDLKPIDVERLKMWREQRPWHHSQTTKPINELRITRGAYPAETIDHMGRFLIAAEQENERVKAVLLFALLCILESISYTRKDGQYLRWDYRSGRRAGGKVFDKGEILPFDKAMTDKLNEIVTDLRETEVPTDLLATPRSKADVLLYRGSCLDILPKLKAKSYDCLVTSPPTATATTTLAPTLWNSLYWEWTKRKSLGSDRRC